MGWRIPDSGALLFDTAQEDNELTSYSLGIGTVQVRAGFG